jgi:hypothetical protein
MALSEAAVPDFRVFLPEIERIRHNSGLGGDNIQRLVQPAVTEDGKKAPELKFCECDRAGL